MRVAHIDLVSCTEDETAQRLASLRAMLPAPATSEYERPALYPSTPPPLNRTAAMWHLSSGLNGAQGWI